MRASLQLLPLAPIGGLVAALGQDPYTLPLAHLAGLALLFALIRHSPDRTASALRGFLFSLGYFGLTLAWLIHPFQVNAEAHGWLAPIALALLVTGLAFLWSLTIWLSHNLTPDPTWRAFSTALLLTMTEMFREHLFTGFPWALPGYIWTDQPIGQAASLIGVHGLTALTLFVAALPFTGRRPIASLLLAAGLLAFLHTFGLMRLAAHPSDSANGIPVRIVQPNIPQEEKWPADFAARNRDRLFTLSLAPATETDPVLIIWPETAITWDRLATSQTNLPAATLPPNRQILAGIIRQDDHAVYNSALLHQPNTPITHIDKSRLVPFGEYIPLAGFLSRFGLGPLAVGDSSGFSRGDASTLLTTAGIGPIRVLICYEAIFPGLVRQQHRPIALVQITNDAWFGAYSGPYQHLTHSRMRSIELGIPLMRAANTGISALVDSHGRITAHLSLGETGIIDAPLPPPVSSTVYARLGDAPLHMTLLILLLLQTLQRVRNRERMRSG